MSVVYLFFSFNPVLGVVITLLTYFLEVFIDNTHARLRWQATFASTWIFTVMAAVSNLTVLPFVYGKE